MRVSMYMISIQLWHIFVEDLITKSSLVATLSKKYLFFDVGEAAIDN